MVSTVFKQVLRVVYIRKLLSRCRSIWRMELLVIEIILIVHEATVDTVSSVPIANVNPCNEVGSIKNKNRREMDM
jgi:hypothetical protein